MCVNRYPSCRACPGGSYSQCLRRSVDSPVAFQLARFPLDRTVRTRDWQIWPRETDPSDSGLLARSARLQTMTGRGAINAISLVLIVRAKPVRCRCTAESLHTTNAETSR